MGSAAFASDKPNILFILSDDHATAAMGCYGGPLAALDPTPRLDRLARQGVRLTSVFCTNSICTPSRASILTGQYSHRNGVYKLNDPLDPDKPHVGHALQAAGYTTAIIGKWHLTTRPRGFDHWQVLHRQGQYFNPLLTSADGKQRHKGFSADVMTNQAIDWLDQKRDKRKPFCLMLHYKTVHSPFDFPKRNAKLYGDVQIPEPPSLYEDLSHRSPGSRDYGNTVANTMAPNMVRRKHWQPPKPLKQMTEHDVTRLGYQAFMKRYLRGVKTLDENIGRLLDHLDQAGLADNTIVIYTSDQGYLLGEHGYIDKRWIFEPSLRMPMLIRAPGLIQPGTVCDDIVLNIDFAPLLLDCAGVQAPPRMQGRSFRENLIGQTPDDWRKGMYYRYWMHEKRPAHYGYRTGRYKLIFFYGLGLDITDTPPTTPGWELYDLQKDPRELHNVYDDPAYADVVTRLTREMDALKQTLGDTDDRYPQVMTRRAETSSHSPSRH
ncbi:sulfatase [Planctomycetales bacterium ZRK34]|nr:sulfatase [Planctomycetales bacterium ZRK34]